MANPMAPSYVDLVQYLAEAFLEPLPWMARAGIDWPLFQALVQVSAHAEDDLFTPALAALIELPAESLPQRTKRYHNILGRNAITHLPQYESLVREGSLMGAAASKLDALYQSAGIMLADDELPDHISIELAFMAYLMQQEMQAPSQAKGWQSARKLFVKNHLGTWAFQLAQLLKHSEDSLYQAIGWILAGVLQIEMGQTKKKKRSSMRLPVLEQNATCNLCSFCVQICPTNALAIQETFDQTRLLINDPLCISCKKCVGICPQQTIHLKDLSEAGHDMEVRLLFDSQRSRCPACNTPTVSEVELKAIAEQIGTPAWLAYCMDCRPFFIGG